MLHDNKIIAFLATKNSEQSREFFENVLGLPLLNDDEFALVFDSQGITLRISKIQDFRPSTQYSVLGWQVDDIQKKVKGLSNRGVIFEHFDGFNQDENGVATFPDGTRVAWFKDPDGNMLSITER